MTATPLVILFAIVMFVTIGCLGYIKGCHNEQEIARLKRMVDYEQDLRKTHRSIILNNQRDIEKLKKELENIQIRMIAQVRISELPDNYFSDTMQSIQNFLDEIKGRYE